MKYLPTEFDGLYVIEPAVFEDQRGYFMETYNWEKESAPPYVYQWVQDNEAKSHKGVLRGLHFQTGDDAQAKLVRVVIGSVQDVVVDLRPESPQYGKSFSIILSGENKKQLLVPRGFAHGYLVLEDDTIFAYKCDNFYQPKSEGGILYNDPALNIQWLIQEEHLLLSQKDLVLETLANSPTFEFE